MLKKLFSVSSKKNEGTNLNFSTLFSFVSAVVQLKGDFVPAESHICKSGRLTKDQLDL